MDAGVDIVNFDAFAYGETIAVYPDHVRKHLESGKILAFGVVPTSPIIREQTVDMLVAQYEEVVDNLSEKSGLDKQLVAEQTIVTPSCGTGSMEIADAEKVFELTQALSVALKATYGF